MKLILKVVRPVIHQGEGKVIVHSNFYLEPGDDGYEEYLTPEFDAGQVPTGKMLPEVIVGKDYPYPPSATREQIDSDMKKLRLKLAVEFTAARNKSLELQDMVGLEYRED